MILRYNEDIRREIEKAELSAFQVAEEMQMSEYAFIGYINAPMTDSRKKMVRKAIAELIKDKAV